MRGVLAVLLVSLASAMSPSSQRDLPTEAYLSLVLRYSTSERAEAADELGAWPLERLQAALRDLPVTLPDVSKRQGLSTARIVATAMTVHVDIARRADASEKIDRFLFLGERLTQLLPTDDHDVDGRVARFRARWHHAAGTVLFGASRPAEALRHFEVARRLHPQDPGILLALGSAYEREASVLVQQRAESGAPRDADDAEAARSAAQRLVLAAELFESALAITPDLHEAGLRAARTRYLLRQPEQASVAIGRISDRVTDSYLRYLACLISGSISEALGKAEHAIAEYRRARAICDRCPSASIALSHALLRAGDHETARQLVDDVVTDNTWPPPRDPWWTYQLGPWHAIDAILEQLRQELPA